MIRVLMALMLTAVTSLCAASGVGRIGKVVVIDRETGVALMPHLYKGEYWVAGVPGARYAIEIRNRLGERLLAVTSVDGVNVITGETAAWSQDGYVFSPQEQYQITGWRKSNAEVAAFTFTALPNSYAARTGRPANVGVIGIALFREQQPQLTVAPRERPSNAPVADASVNMPLSAADISARALDAPKSQEADAALSEEVVVTGSRVQRPASPTAHTPEEKLGTGHGAREYSFVVPTDFMRSQSQPNELIRIHYDSLENLTAMGIIRPALPQPPDANPFPDSPGFGYVPDPPG